MDLNDDCVYAVLKRMSPSSLCSMRFMNRRLRGLVFDVVKHKYKNESIVLDTKRLPDNKFKLRVIKESQVHLKCFIKYIPNIGIMNSSTCDTSGTNYIFHLLHSVGAVRLGSLKITRIFHFNDRIPLNGELIKNLLEKVNKLTLACHYGGIYNDFLKYCENVKELEIQCNVCSIESIMFTYPNLKTLTTSSQGNISDLYQTNAEAIDRFFQQNPQIDDITSSSIASIRP